MTLRDINMDKRTENSIHIHIFIEALDEKERKKWEKMGVFRAGSGRGEGSVKGLGNSIIDSSHSETSNAGALSSRLPLLCCTESNMFEI